MGMKHATLGNVAKKIVKMFHTGLNARPSGNNICIIEKHIILGLPGGDTCI